MKAENHENYIRVDIHNDRRLKKKWLLSNKDELVQKR